MKQSLMVGYLESWGGITFTQAAARGYDAIIMAFGEIKGTSQNVLVAPFAERFNPSPSPELLKQDILQAKSAGARQILFSVGGANNTYLPGDATADSVAQAVVSYLQEYGFTGIDFDLEIPTSGDYLLALCKGIKERDPSLLITAAPQINQAAHDSGLFFVSTGNEQPYNKALKQGYFDYLFVQAYNNGWPQIEGADEKMVRFISEGFQSLKKCVPAGTRIAMGEPACARAAGETSVFFGPSGDKNIYQLMAQQYAAIKDDDQFGGAMVWDINWDAQSNYSFVNTVKGSL